MAQNRFSRLIAAREAISRSVFGLTGEETQETTDSMTGVRSSPRDHIPERSAEALQRQLVVSIAEADAAKKTIDILVKQGNVNRLERESVHIVARSTMLAAEEIANESKDMVETLLSQRIVLKAISNASASVKNYELQL